MIKKIKYILLIQLLLLNCTNNNNTTEIRIKKYIANYAEKQLGFNSDFYNDYELNKISFDSSFINYDIYHALYTLASPSVEFYVAYQNISGEIINLEIFKNTTPTGFSKIINYENLLVESDVRKILTLYFQIFKINVINDISDIKGINKTSNFENIIKPILIKLNNNTWSVKFFAWSDRSGKIIQHEITINKKDGFHDNMKIIAENIGNWKAPM